jgi:hypothetical protein
MNYQSIRRPLVIVSALLFHMFLVFFTFAFELELYRETYYPGRWKKRMS